MLKLSSVVILIIVMTLRVSADEMRSTYIRVPKGEITNFHQTRPIEAKDAGKYGMENSIKSKKLDNYPTMKIGEAFEKYSYFEARTWKVTQLSPLKTYIDFTGMFKKNYFSFASAKKGVSQQGVEIKFVVYENGRFAIAMISKVEILTNGMINRYPLENTKAILDNIYGNREITF